MTKKVFSLLLCLALLLPVFSGCDNVNEAEEYAKSLGWYGELTQELDLSSKAQVDQMAAQVKFPGATTDEAPISVTVLQTVMTDVGVYILTETNVAEDFPIEGRISWQARELIVPDEVSALPLGALHQVFTEGGTHTNRTLFLFRYFNEAAPLSPGTEVTLSLSLLAFPNQGQVSYIDDSARTVTWTL